MYNPRRARGSQSGREKRRDESFQIREKELLGTESHRTISKNSSGFRLLIGHKKMRCIIVPVLFVSSYTTAIFSSNEPIDGKSQEATSGSFRYCVITPRASIIANLLLKMGELIMHSANPLIGNGMEFDVLPLRSC